jgi:hypothetical protein
MKNVQLTLALTAFAAAQLLGYAGTARAQESASKEASDLLFPYVSNQDGFDTVITIANTANDPFGSRNKAGVCTFHFYGSGAPAGPIPTPQIDPGAYFQDVVSDFAPGFAGYIISACDFSYGHGGAILTGAASGSYQALVIQTPREDGENLNN